MTEPGLDPEAVLFSLRAEGCLGGSNVPMDRTTDLETALSFVVRRIEEQSKVSDHPLNDEERSLLENLPSSPIDYLTWDPEIGPPKLVPRNISLERLCALAKAAYLSDHKINSESLDWEFAFAVSSHVGCPELGRRENVPETVVGPAFCDFRRTPPGNCRDIPRMERTADTIPLGRNSLRNRCYHAFDLLRFAADCAMAVGESY
jgi:hypothetical protein